jgi:hypothetical protein
MFVEVMRMAAANLGVTLEFHREFGARQGDLSPLGWFEILPGKPPSAEFTNEVLGQRRTSRLQLRNERVPAALVEVLRTIAAEGGQTLGYVSDPRLIQKVVTLNVRTMISDMNTADYHDEIVRWFRYEDEEARRSQDGLSARCMGVSPARFRFFARHPYVADLPFVGPFLRQDYRTSLGQTPQIGILNGRFFEPEAAFATGRMFVRLWLAMAREQVYLLPFGNLVTNRRARQQTMALTGAPNPWVVFRFGYSDVPPESYRLDTRRLFL